MKVLITGSNGQLGWELQRCVPEGVRVAAFSSSKLDITDESSVQKIIAEVGPDVIINAAAYTAVDKAEQEKERAYLVNSQGAEHLARCAASLSIKVVHISTDFVFNGKSSTPYLPGDQTDPLGVYGASKLAGEKNLIDIMAGPNLTIVRTAWLYSSHANNFVKTMLRLMAEKDKLGVVADQIGSPTWACGLARAIWQIIQGNISGLYHWTDAGVASWYDFAVAIQEEAIDIGLLKKAIPLAPLRTEEYPTPAKRPACVLLDKTDLWHKIDETPSHWRVSLREMLKEIENV